MHTKSITVDSTTLSWYTDCPMKYKLRVLDNIVPKEKAMALSYGAVTHQAMAVWYLRGNLAQTLKIFNENFKEREGEKVRTLLIGLRTLKEYTEKYVKEPFEIVMVEKPYAMNLTDDIILSGRLDAIIKWNKLSLVLEHKTTTRMGFSYFKQFTPNTQIDIYSLLCRELIGHCEGVYVNAIAVSTKDEETRQKEALSNKKKVARNSNYYREIISRTPKQLESAKQNIIKIVKAMEFAIKENSFFQDKNNCTSYSGCAYRDICNTEFDERVIRLRYKREKWNPLLGRTEEI